MKAFEIFCSYAHADDDDGWVEKFVQELTSICSKLVGERFSVFLDREALITAQIWEKKIKSAIGSSGVMIAVLSPSYVRSEWCQNEWHLFAEREMQARNLGLLAEDEGLIFPVLLYPFDRGRFDREQQDFVNEVRKRQWLDVSSQLPGTPIRPGQLRHLAESIIDVLIGIENKLLQESNSRSSISHGIIVDSEHNLTWSSSISPSELTYDEASRYVDDLTIDGITGWRLPSERELFSLILKSEADKEPDERASPALREPFNSQRYGYLHSSTLVGATKSNYIMNVRNGRIFDSEGRKAYVRAVRSRLATTPSAIYVLFRNAIISQRQVVCTYQNRQRRFFPHTIGNNKVGEEVVLACELVDGHQRQWRCLRLVNVTDARTEDGHWDGEDFNRPQSCVSNVDLDLSVHARKKPS